MNKSPEKKDEIRVSTKALRWLISLTFLLTACGDPSSGDNVADVEAAVASLPTLTTPIPMETEKAVKPTINPVGTEPAPIIRHMPKLAKPPEDLK